MWGSFVVSDIQVSFWELLFINYKDHSVLKFTLEYWETTMFCKGSGSLG